MNFYEVVGFKSEVVDCDGTECKYCSGEISTNKFIILDDDDTIEEYEEREKLSKENSDSDE